MNAKSHENLKIIRFEGELLPHWAQLLDVAARLASAPADTRRWFSRLTSSAGTDRANTVIEHCTRLRTSIEKNRESILAELQRSQGDNQPPQILAAWNYAMDTMIQAARSRKTCAWVVEGAESLDSDDCDGGDITLRRV